MAELFPALFDRNPALSPTRNRPHRKKWAVRSRIRYHLTGVDIAWPCSRPCAHPFRRVVPFIFGSCPISGSSIQNAPTNEFNQQPGGSVVHSIAVEIQFTRRETYDDFLRLWPRDTCIQASYSRQSEVMTLVHINDTSGFGWQRNCHIPDDR